jgi:hypothetical protein
VIVSPPWPPFRCWEQHAWILDGMDPIQRYSSGHSVVRVYDFCTRSLFLSPLVCACVHVCPVASGLLSGIHRALVLSGGYYLAVWSSAAWVDPASQESLVRLADVGVVILGSCGYSTRLFLLLQNGARLVITLLSLVTEALFMVQNHDSFPPMPCPCVPVQSQYAIPQVSDVDIWTIVLSKALLLSPCTRPKKL